MRWWMDATVKFGLAYLPNGHAIHRLLQERFGELARLETCTRFDNARNLLETAASHVASFDSLHVVELGTGWVPAVPLAFALCGARVDTFDVTRFVSPRLFQRSVARIGDFVNPYATASGCDVAAVRRRWQSVRNVADFDIAMKRLGGSYVAPCDTRRLPFAAGSVDLVVSNLVLQCIPAKILGSVLAESFRVLKPGGKALHRVGLQDEYSKSDPTRNSLEFLSYSRLMWNLVFNHPLKHVNRLRRSSYHEMFRRIGFEVRTEKRVVDWDSIPRLKQRGVAPEFRELSWDDIATTAFCIVLEKPRNSFPIDETGVNPTSSEIANPGNEDLSVATKSENEVVTV